MKKIKLYIIIFFLQLGTYQGVSQVSPFMAIHTPDANGIPDCQQLDTNLYFTIFQHSGILDAVNNVPPLVLMDYNTLSFAMPGWYSDNGISYYYWSGGAWDLCVEYCGLQPISISGDSVVYANSSTNYTVLDTAGSSYNWVVTNGNVSSGQGTGDVQIQWGTQGSGQITLIQTSLNGCIDTLLMSVTVLHNTSIEINNKTNLVVYPNPTHDLITIDVKGYQGSVNVEVYDLSGRLLMSTTKASISLRDHAKGIYVFKISYGKFTQEIRVSKE